MKLIIAAAAPLIATLLLTSGLSAKSPDQLEKQIQKNVSLPEDFEISLFASGMKQPRLMVQTPSGDLIVSSYGSKIYLVSKTSDIGQGSESVQTLMSGLSQPHGVLLDGDWLYVAEQHRVTRIRFDADNNKVSGKREIVLTGLPDNGGHFSRTLKKGPDGWFYLTIGSSCNV